MAKSEKKAEKKAKKSKKVEEEVRVLRTLPKYPNYPEGWPGKANYFPNWKGWQLYEPENGGAPYYENTGIEQGDYPTYIPGSYCEERVGKELGLAAEDNVIGVVGDYGKVWLPIFKSDKYDNIEILFYNLDRELFPLDSKELTKTEQQSDNKKDPGVYHRTRLHPSRAKDGCKYLSPERKQSGESHPFLPPQIVEAWEKGEEIETLVITEGEFKAMKACMCGGHVIGIGGIQMFYNTTTREVYHDVLRLVQDCKVKNLVFLHDGDCTDISEKALKSRDGSGQPDSDLAERPRNFMQSAREFYRIHHQVMPNVKIYWQYINSKAIPGAPKGLDDLLCALPNEQDRIIKEMEDVKCVTAFFHRVNVSAEYQRLSEHFFLDSVKNFYNRHKNEIDPEPTEAGQSKEYHSFLWYGTIYQWDDSKKEVIEILSKDKLCYKRIGTSWYKEVKKPTIGKDKNGNIIMTEILVPWSRQNITDDFGTEVLSKLHKYDGFVNLPSHEDFRKIIRNFYNLYRPLVYQPSDDDLAEHGFPHILSTLEHIFGQDNKGRGLKPGDEGYDESSQFELGCDYMQLLYHQPTQNLPILCLVSNERGTGKTSFLDLTQVMFSDNTVIVGNEQITSNFNTLVAGRLIVGVDESSLADNKKFTEQLKMWSTSKMQSVEGKGKDAYQIENFTKYILCSNNERRFIYASDEEVRFWVRKVPKLPEGTKIGNIKPFYEQEMPAFLAWLNKRAMFYAPDDPKKIDRMYFPPELLHTKWLDELLEAQRPRPEKKMREWLRQWFIDFGKKELLSTADKLQEAIGKTDKKFLTYDLDDLKRYIEENMHVQKFGGGSGKSKRFSYYIVSNWIPQDDKGGEMFTKEKIEGNGRPYQFLAKDFMSLQEYYELFPDERPQGEQKEIEFDRPS